MLSAEKKSLEGWTGDKEDIVHVAFKNTLDTGSHNVPVDSVENGLDDNIL